jgi:outer membrane receptor protein involved in Fe transport
VANTGSVQVGNPDLSPQQAWVVEAAFEQRFWTRGAAILTVRHYELKDVIDRVPIYGPGGAAADAPGNIGDGTKDELVVSMTVPLERFGVKAAQLKAEATRRWSEVTDPTTLRTRAISELHPVDWSAHFTQDLPRWRTTWGVDVMSGFRERFYRLAEVETTKQDTWVVVYAESKLRPDLSFRIELQNAAQRGVERIREVYAGPRNTSPLDYTDVRDLDFGQALYIQLRKSIG